MNFLWCFFCLSLIGWVCLIAGIIQSRKYRSRIAGQTERSEGVIVGYEEAMKSWGRSYTTVYHPIVSYCVRGHEYRRATAFYYMELRNAAPRRPAEGSNVVIFYNPALPFEFHLEEDRNETGSGMIRIGGIILILAVVLSVLLSFLLK